MESSQAIKVKCPKCGAEFFLPEVPDLVQGQVQNVLRRAGRVQAILELRTRAKLSLSDAKAIAFHLADGVDCHRCKTKLIGNRTVQYCAKCNALNVGW